MLVRKYMKFVETAVDDKIFLISGDYIFIYTYMKLSRDAFTMFTKVIQSINEALPFYYVFNMME